MKIRFLQFFIFAFAVVAHANAQDLADDLGQDLLLEIEQEKKDKAPATPITTAPPAQVRKQQRKAPTNQVTVVVPHSSTSQLAKSIGAHFDPERRLLVDEIGRCQIMLPAAPTFSKLRAETKFATIIIRNLELKMKGAIITVAHTRYPQEFTDGYNVDVEKDPYKLLTLASDSQLRTRAESKLIARENLEVEELPAIEQVITLPELTLADGSKDASRVVFNRCILRDRDMYAININIEKDAYQKNPSKSKESVKKFMNSFRLIR